MVGGVVKCENGCEVKFNHFTGWVQKNCPPIVLKEECFFLILTHFMGYHYTVETYYSEAYTMKN